MNKLPLDIQVEFFKVYGDEVPVADFESWLYANKELEHYLGEETYVDLVSLNFKDRHIKHEMGKVIDPFLDFGKCEERRLIRLLSDLIERTQAFGRSLIDTYDLYCSGYYFFDNLGLGYGLNFANDYWNYSDWEKLTDEEKEVRIDKVYGAVKAEAQIVLNWIEEQKVIPTGKKDEIGRFEFIDKRTDSERNLRTVEVIALNENERTTGSAWSEPANLPNSEVGPLRKLWSRLRGI